MHWSLTVAVLLLLALGAALATNLIGGRFTSAPAARSHHFLHESLLSLPLAAQGPISAALGADGTAYRVDPWEGGLRAWSSAQRLSAKFTNSGVSVLSGTTHLAFSLLGVGYGSALAAVGQVAPSAHANRVIYRHPDLNEWYANGPLGLEQGFTITRRPGGRQAGPLTLSIGLSGNATASLRKGGQVIVLHREGKSVLRYSGLSATDAHGRMLHSWLGLRGAEVLLHVDTRHARFPLRIDPFFQQDEKLTANDETGVGNFGASVALSSDGNTALVGAIADNENLGAAWVFVRSGQTWTQQGGKLTGAGESAAGQFGWSVALSADGNTALIGAPTDNSGSGSNGAAWVFVRSGQTWTQQSAKITASGESGEGDFGVTVALSVDGNTALIGAPADDGRIGAAWAFTRTGSAWTQQGEKLTTGPQNESYVDFGASVALSGDGNTALIGAPSSYRAVGAAFLFARSGQTWTKQQEILGAGELEAGEFGSSVAISSDGNTALVGALLDNNATGAAWAFVREGQTWSQQGAKLTGAGESTNGGLFGASVALSSDGNTALVGAYNDHQLNHPREGSAFLFARSGGIWTQQGEKLMASDETGAGYFGRSVALSADANTALIGGYAGAGAVWAYTNGETAPRPEGAGGSSGSGGGKLRERSRGQSHPYPIDGR